MFYYIFVILEFDPKNLIFAGQEEIDTPMVDFEGEYILPNRQRRINKNVADMLLLIIHEQYPKSRSGQVLRVVLRKFPENRKRYIVIIREEKARARYILLEDTLGNIKIQERNEIKRNLPKINEQIKKETQAIEKIELIVDQAQTTKNIKVD